MARRITPIAVDQPEGGQGLATHSLAFEGPLDVGPAPDQGDVRAVHSDLGAGRRVWVDIQGSWQVKFKQVLRQQGLDYKAWEHEQKDKYEDHFKQLFGEDEKRKDRPNIIANIQRRMNEMMRPSDSDDDGESLNSEDDSEEEGDGEDEEGGDDGSSDDGEGVCAGDEIDLDKDDDKGKKPKRQRFERYEDDFIDDSEIERVKGGPKVKTLYSGFFINKGQIEVVEEATKQRRRAPKPAAADAAAAAAGGGDGAGSGQPPPAKRRKQQDQQQKQQGQQEQQLKQKQKQKEAGQQQQQQEAPQAAKQRKKPKQGEPAAAAAAAAGGGSDLSDAGGRKKRARGDATEAAPEGEAATAAAAPASKRARKASPATSEAAAAAAPPPPQLPPAAGNAGRGTAAAAVAAARAAASRRPPAAGSTPAAALPPAGPGAAEQAAPQQQQQQQKQQRRQNSQEQQQQQEEPCKAAAAVFAVFPGASQPEAAAAGGEAAAAAAAAAAATAGDEGVPAGLPEDVVAAAMALQKVVQEHDAAVNGPAANAASRKVITAPLSTLGLAFASLPEPQQTQQEAQLLALVRPLLPHLTDKALRKKVLQEPRDKLGALQQHREALLAALGDVKGAQGGGDGNASDDDFQQAWSSAAEDSLVAAWTAAKAAGGQASLEQLALDVCTALGNTAVQGQPAKAVAELQQVVRRAQKRQKEARAAEAATKAAAAAAGDDAAGADDADAAPAAAEAAAPAAAAPAAAAAAGEAKAAAGPRRAGSRQLSPAPSGTAAAAAAVAAAMPAGTPAGKQQQQQQQDGSQDTDAGGEDGAADQPAAEAGTQAAKADFSRWSAPSPRLERCLAAAKAAGASEEWLSEKYTSIRKGSTLGHQTFRILCCTGPAGCEVKDFKAVAETHSLDCQLDDSAQGRRSLRQAISGKGLSSIVGVTEADANKVALLVYPGVVSRPHKPSARTATPLQAGQADGAAAGGEGAADAAAAE